MDTSGHNELSLVGEKLLKPALERANHKKMRIGAFYLGNWLTDVSQAVDARAYRSLKGRSHGILDDIDRIFDRVSLDLPSWIPSYLVTVTDKLVADLRASVKAKSAELRKQVEVILAEGANGELAKTFRTAFRFKGYFKFVAAEDGGVGKEKERMDVDCYNDVFKDRYREYFPFEHLDRPETAPNQYDARTGQPPQNKYTKPTPGGPGVYSYLRENTKIAAGILADLDAGVAASPPKLSWAAGTFHPSHDSFTDQNGNQQAVDDKNYEWNRHLALLGHALHAVEDFFAHSTFVEHASMGHGKDTGLPASYRRFQRVEEQESLVRRLKRWSPGVDAKPLSDVPNESDIVTGYFDFSDTLISLAHMIEEIWGLDRDKIGKSVDDSLDYKFSKLLTDTLELCEDPKKVWDDPANNSNVHGYDEDLGNMAVQILRQKGGTALKLAEGREAILNQVAREVAEAVFAKKYPKSVHDDFVDAVVSLGRVVGLYSMYKTLKQFSRFVIDPVAWFGQFLPKYVEDLLKTYGSVYLRRMVAHLFGADRIGCHSQIAKDTGPELFHKAAMDCAKAVHWYIVHALVRHSTEKTVAVARGDATLKTVNSLYQWEWIDWLELLEYFLAHPYASAAVTVAPRKVAASVVHTTRKDPHSKMSPDTLKSLAKEYSKNFVAVPGGPASMTWDVIADANFPTAGMSTEHRKNQINAVIRHQGNTGILVSDHINYAFRPGLSLVIPYQATDLPEVRVPDGVRLWWYPVIVDDWKRLPESYEEGKASPKSGKTGHQWLPVPHKEVLQLIDEAETLRQRLEKAYRT